MNIVGTFVLVVNICSQPVGATAADIQCGKTVIPDFFGTEIQCVETGQRIAVEVEARVLAVYPDTKITATGSCTTDMSKSAKIDIQDIPEVK